MQIEGLTPEEQEIINYLEQNFNPFVEEIVVNILKIRPENSYEFILSFLETEGLNI